MIILKYSWLMLALHLFTTTDEKEVLWKISSESEVGIHGSTNVSNFLCTASKYKGSDFLIENFTPDQDQSEWMGEISIESNTFNCFNKMMTNDFQETVQAEDHPEIRVRFINLIGNPSGKENQNLKGSVEIILAGISHCYPISCKLESTENGRMILKGKQQVHFSDFHIDPPSKFLGAVKVHNAITVQFELYLDKS